MPDGKKGEQMDKFKILMVLVTVVGLISIAPHSGSAEKTVLHTFDREACYSSCGCDAVGMIAECFDCKQECDRKYWAEFDKEMGENNKGSNDDSN